jgi:hypothetical protein
MTGDETPGVHYPFCAIAGAGCGDGNSVACQPTASYSWSQYAQDGRYSLSNRDGVISLQWHHGLNAEDWPIIPTNPTTLMGVTFQRDVGIYVPFGLLVGMFMALPTIWFTATTRRKFSMGQTGQHRCPTCGYDLRATPDRCPECGGTVNCRS